MIIVVAIGLLLIGVVLRPLVSLLLATPYLRAGNAKVARHDFKGAIGDYTKVAGLTPAVGLFYRANAKRMEGDLSGSLADYDGALRLAAKVPEILNGRALAKRALGDLEGARAFSSFEPASAPAST